MMKNKFYSLLKEIRQLGTNKFSAFLLPSLFTTVIAYIADCNWSALKKKRIMEWFFKLDIRLQRLILCCVYLSFFLFFYWLFSTSMLGSWLPALRRLILSLIDAGEPDQQDKKQQQAKPRGKGKGGTTPAGHQSQASTSTQDNQASKGKGGRTPAGHQSQASTSTQDNQASKSKSFVAGSGCGKKNKKKTSANDWQASTNRDQRSASSMQDVVNTGRDECRTLADQVKKLQLFNQRPKQQQRLPAVSPIDQGEKVQPMVANYETLGDSPDQVGKNLAKYFGPKGIIKTPDDHRKN